MNLRKVQSYQISKGLLSGVYFEDNTPTKVQTIKSINKKTIETLNSCNSQLIESEKKARKSPNKLNLRLNKAPTSLP